MWKRFGKPRYDLAIRRYSVIYLWYCDLEVSIFKSLMGSVVDGIDIESLQMRASWETTCWGCGLRVILPKYAPTFRCGWCGAITIDNANTKPISPWSRRCSKGRDQVFVFLVLSLTLSIVCGGIWSTFPVLFPTATVGFYIHSAITTILSFNTLFNYCMAAFRRAGPPPTVVWGRYDSVPRQSFEGYKFCVYCELPKPPNAHHCRSCQSCVVEMDHHCPFIGNCVGSNNHRHFLLFLFFASVSGLYVLTMSTYVGSKLWPKMLRFRRGNMPRLHGGASYDVLADLLVTMFLSLEPVTSTRAFSLISLSIASFSLVIGVGVLLFHQVKLVYTGETYIDSLSSSGRGHEQNKSWKNLRKVFGKQHPFLWLLPRINSKCLQAYVKSHAG